uniref:Uncharacterized protein n=1 Tax=Setaria viridis TaxID=4556 RepID=A0A4U6VCV1_SETVI|nr:hypothetical protein SEVIR_3G247366v2 [Setaria viridis]TKW27281.1 hypothetical protein SEVIR_3G247366v2 [Setaria viridis]
MNPILQKKSNNCNSGDLTLNGEQVNSGAGQLHRNTQPVQPTEGTSSAPTLRPAQWSAKQLWKAWVGTAQGQVLHVAGFAATTPEGRSLIVQRITEDRATPIACSVNKSLKRLDHLFASCSYTKQVWFAIGILGHANLQMPSAAAQTIDWWHH